MTNDDPERVIRVEHRRSLRKAASRGGGGRGPVLLAVTVVGVWSVSTLADVFSSSYSPPEGLNTVALAAATFLFSYAFRRENRDD